MAEQRPPGPPEPDWLGRLAHDLRNPITPMRSAVQLLQIGQLPADLAPDLLRTLDRQLDFLLQLITDVDDLVKIERGAFALRLATCDLGQVAASAVARHARAVGQGGRVAAEVVLDAPPAPVWVHADEVRLRQLVELLLGLLGDGGGSMHVETLDGDGGLRLRDGGRSLAADPRVDFLAGGPAPADAAVLNFGHLVGRHIVAGHGAQLLPDADGVALVLRVPRADPAA